MKDEILEGYVNDFAENYEFENCRSEVIFEKFVNYCVVSRLYPRDFEIDDLSIGGSNDIGIDGVAIIINGNIITDEDEIDYFIKQNGCLDVTFVLIQSKTQSHFEGSDVGTFLYGVKAFFDDRPSIPENEKIKKLRIIKDAVYKNSIKFDHLPELKLYYVTTGKWQGPEQIKGRAERELSDLEEKKIFSKRPEIEFIGAEELKIAYRELQRKVVREISVINPFSLPDFPEQTKIKQALLGYVSVKSYLSLVETEDGELSKGLFYDNIRDFQGFNSVNKEIEETLKSEIDRNLLSLLNNGITIISKKIDRLGNKIKLSDFQIVNGCQTTNVIYDNRDSISEETYIILKIIETEDKEVTNKIIRATNRQTEVKEEAFESIKPFHRDLQDFYKEKSKTIQPAIYYERRSKEYVGDSKVKPTQVISLASQIKAYISTVLTQPQSTHRYFGELLNANKDKLFQTNHEFYDYYYSALLVTRIYTCYKKQMIKKLHPSYKYHIALIIFKITKKLLNKDFTYNNLLDKTNDNEWLNKLILDSAKFIYNKRQEVGISSRDAVRNKEFTSILIESLPNSGINL